MGKCPLFSEFKGKNQQQKTQQRLKGEKIWGELPFKNAALRWAYKRSEQKSLIYIGDKYNGD